jgi:hypothetical protein
LGAWMPWKRIFFRFFRSGIIKVIHFGHRKELFEFICLEKLKRSISPRDFEEMGKIASIRSLRKNSSFAKIVILLQDWFPA